MWYWSMDGVLVLDPQRHSSWLQYFELGLNFYSLLSTFCPSRKLYSWTIYCLNHLEMTTSAHRVLRIMGTLSNSDTVSKRDHCCTRLNFQVSRFRIVASTKGPWNDLLMSVKSLRISPMTGPDSPHNRKQGIELITTWFSNNQTFHDISQITWTFKF